MDDVAEGSEAAATAVAPKTKPNTFYASGNGSSLYVSLSVALRSVCFLLSDCLGMC